MRGKRVGVETYDGDVVARAVALVADLALGYLGHEAFRQLCVSL